MDFTTEHMDQGLNGLETLTGSDQSALSALPDSAKSEYITTTISGILNSQNVARHNSDALENGTLHEARAENSPRLQTRDTLKGALENRTPANSNALRSVGMAHLLWMQKNGMSLPANVSFSPSDDDLNAGEIEALNGIVRFYDTNDRVALQNDFQRASNIQGNIEIRQRAELADAAERAADIAYVKDGLKIMGYLPRDVVNDDITPEQLKSAIGQYAAENHMGLQAQGAAADYANLHYNNANIYTQRDAMYARGSSELIDSKMARAMVETGLGTDGLPATLTNGSGGMNYSAVHTMAERGGLIPVPDDYLSDDQKAIFDALGGQTSAAGQAHLRNMIAQDNGEWYGKGLQQIAEPVLAAPAVDVVREIAPLTPGREYPEHIVDSATVWNAIPSQVPDDLSDDVKEPLETMVGYKNEYISAEAAYHAPGGDRMIIVGNYDRAAANMGMIEEQLRADGGWDKVQNHLFNQQGPAPAPTAPENYQDMDFGSPAADTPVAESGGLTNWLKENFGIGAQAAPVETDAPAAAPAQQPKPAYDIFQSASP